MHAISSYRGNRHRPPQTQRQDRLQYTVPLASMQCNKEETPGCSEKEHTQKHRENYKAFVTVDVPSTMIELFSRHSLVGSQHLKISTIFLSSASYAMSMY